MEIAIIILVIGLLFYLANKRFKGFVRSDFYLDKPNLPALNHCQKGDQTRVTWIKGKNQIEVYSHDQLIGYIPDDYKNIIKRHLKEGDSLEGRISAINKHGCKVQLDIRGEARDIIGG